MSTATPEQSVFVPKTPIKHAATIGLQAGAVGVFVSAIQNALDKHSRGASGFLTRTGGTIGFFAAMGATFAFTEAAVANQRQRDDLINGAAGACAAGFLAGLRARSLPMAVGSCAIMGAAMGTFDYAGSLTGDQSISNEERRKRFFKQPPQTLAD
ncbi:hypothetical protein PTI98_001232 [Pleurotus ostreatus]|uniref:NDUFA11/TIM22, NADH dehydrogenase 1 alpha subcomplex, 14.7kDa subunit n=1 Tax=Pleurotus ostreatus (strain PC15) TaxID=1137138 RepID=A0A067NS24_PLEO1|nr:hypothetical protein PTI98_001232 [Pleurotus ostreatus]KDQ30853.1 NDUFA11/TIM22, NADH dehydrogenase 1 alpha subcomplex, 14.7kDa subunit [Pleurotus ostreatus PC15]